MYIESIELKDYRNYETLSLNFDKGTNIFYGDNAQGKTNILEAVYLCGTTKSHRGSKDREMIRFHADESHIRMFVKKEGISRKIDMHLKKNKAKGQNSGENGFYQEQGGGALQIVDGAAAFLYHPGHGGEVGIQQYQLGNRAGGITAGGHGNTAIRLF